MVGRRDHGETPEGKLRDHLAHIDGANRKKIEEIRALAKAGHLSIEAFGGALKELIRASTTNPLIGCVVAIIVADVLRQAKVLSPAAAQVIFVIAGTGAGVQIGAEIISVIEGFVPWGHTPSGDTDILRPTASTVVYGNEAGKGHEPTVPAGALGIVTRHPEVAEAALAA